MALPLDRQTLRAELESSKTILTNLIAAVDSDIPGEDVPAAPARLEAFVIEMANELELVAGKCFTLAGILSGDR